MANNRPADIKFYAVFSYQELPRPDCLAAALLPSSHGEQGSTYLSGQAGNDLLS